ncbi:MAG: hypothetical protein LLG04_14205 [Parachlamydia sp.]|nr:hypothetical protein [Parachlamydia sp.]
MNIIDHGEMEAICQLAQTAGPQQLKRLSDEERKVVSLMVKALSKGKETIATDMDIKALKDHLSTPDLSKSSSRGDRIAKGIKNIFAGRVSSEKLSREIDKINPLKKSPREVRQAQITFHENITSDLDHMLENLRGRKDGIVQVLAYYRMLSETRNEREQIRYLDQTIQSIQSILPKQLPKNPVLLETDRQLRQCLPVLKRLRLETNAERSRLLKESIQVMENQFQKCLRDHFSMNQMLVQENQILQKLRHS